MMQKMRRYEIIRLHRILIERACSAYTQAIQDGHTDPLLAVAMFILDFTCIHPFNDGNGRMSRLLTLLMLYRNGYMVGKYISIEHLMGMRTESWTLGRPDWSPHVFDGGSAQGR